jgi:hypothetical protein
MQKTNVGATPEEQIVHYAIEFIGARDAHKRAAPSQKDAARDAKHEKERALDKAVRALPRATVKTPPTDTR